MKKILLLTILIILGLGAVGIFYLVKKSEPSKPQVAGVQSENNQPSQITNNHLPITDYRIPILMYHYIRDYNDPNDEIGTNLSVSPQKFESQLQWLKENNYQTVNPDYLTKPYALPASPSGGSSKPIILTLDDGYKDAYTNAFPILKKYDFKATFYIIVNYPDNKDQYMNWDQIKELKNAGMNIGSHTLTHPDLEKADDSRVDQEIGESKEVLSKRLEIEITDFCYPAGKYNERTIETLKKYGYKTATTVKNGIADQDSSLYELPRIRMTNEINLNNILSTNYE